MDRRQLLAALKSELGRDASDFSLAAPPDDKSIFRYEMHTLPNEIGDRIGTSTLFAAWNAAIYVNQIEDERLDEVVTTGAYLDATQAVLQKHGGLWFNDESFVVSAAAEIVAGDRAAAADAGADLRRRIAEFAARASLEITANDRELAGHAARALAGRQRRSTSRTRRTRRLRMWRRPPALSSAPGFAACPHVVARRIASRAELESALARLRERRRHARAAGRRRPVAAGGRVLEHARHPRVGRA